MENLKLTTININDSETIIKTIYTKKIICSIPTVDPKEAYDFAKWLETASYDNYLKNDLIQQELKLLLEICGGEDIDVWLKETLPQLTS